MPPPSFPPFFPLFAQAHKRSLWREFKLVEKIQGTLSLSPPSFFSFFPSFFSFLYILLMQGVKLLVGTFVVIVFFFYYHTELNSLYHFLCFFLLLFPLPCGGNLNVHHPFFFLLALFFLLFPLLFFLSLLSLMVVNSLKGCHLLLFLLWGVSTPPQH